MDKLEARGAIIQWLLGLMDEQGDPPVDLNPESPDGILLTLEDSTEVPGGSIEITTNHGIFEINVRRTQ